MQCEGNNEDELDVYSGGVWCCVDMVVVIPVSTHATSIDCMQPTPGGNPCQDCHASWLPVLGVWRYWSCNGSAYESFCAMQTPEDGWKCEEVSNECPGKVVDYEDVGCTIEKQNQSDADCVANYVTATAADHGNAPVCPIE